MRLIASIAMVALALAVTACGGDDDEDSAATTDQGAKAGQATSGNGNGGGSGNGGSGSGGSTSTGAETPEALASCLEEGGYEPVLVPPPPEGEPGSEFKSVGSVRLDLGSGKVVAAVFFDSSKDAQGLKQSSLGKQGTSQVIGDVYVSAGKGGSQELGAVKACLKG